MNTQAKILSPGYSEKQLSEGVETLARPLVFTNGCFDILHRGHCHYLEQARNLGAALVIGVNSDDSVKRQNKGSDRPINCLADRMSVLASLQCVDLVVSFEDDTPLELIAQILPNHLAKGGDWAVENIVGADVVQQSGGQVHSITFQFDRSTTDLIEKIRSH